MESGQVITTSVYLPRELREQIGEAAAANGVSIGEFIRIAVTEQLSKGGGE